jgi:hypothetical protein
MTSYLHQVVSALVAALVLIVWTRPQTFKVLLDKDSDFPSLGRQGQYTAMVISTWVLVTITLNGTVAEWLFVGYMVAWAGAQFGSIWLKLKSQVPPGTTTTTETSSRATSTQVKSADKDLGARA